MFNRYRTLEEGMAAVAQIESPVPMRWQLLYLIAASGDNIWEEGSRDGWRDVFGRWVDACRGIPCVEVKIIALRRKIRALGCF